MAAPFQALTDMVPGKKYKVVYKGDLQRFNREAVMVYLGKDGTSTSWDARPAAGTQTMPTSWIVAVVEVEANAKAYLNRRSSHK